MSEIEGAKKGGSGSFAHLVLTESKESCLVEGGFEPLFFSSKCTEIFFQILLNVLRVVGNKILS